ncbi:DUF4292 domain-containing protein [Parapedobacter pyrenivorans]|uniref:DUF4292 domain-containing protein n=1 Tax=Parapedobacter pyrenivorans TaxID=1305674 RepID=UPI0033422957
MEKRVSRAERLNILSNIAQHQLHYVTFSGRAKSSIVINKDSYDVTANVRIEHSKAIWISITALMGIEVGRVLITPDSIKIINRLQSEYIQKPFEYLHNFTSDELDFSSLQHLLVGNVIGKENEEDTEVFKSDGGYLLRGDSNNLLYVAALDADYRTMQTSVDESRRGQRLRAFYSDYRKAVGYDFPHHVKISITAQNLDLRSDMNYSRVVYNEEVEMPFSVPSRYKEIQ